TRNVRSSEGSETTGKGHTSTSLLGPILRKASLSESSRQQPNWIASCWSRRHTVARLTNGRARLSRRTDHNACDCSKAAERHYLRVFSYLGAKRCELKFLHHDGRCSRETGQLRPSGQVVGPRTCRNSDF